MNAKPLLRAGVVPAALLALLLLTLLPNPARAAGTGETAASKGSSVAADRSSESTAESSSSAAGAEAEQDSPSAAGGSAEKVHADAATVGRLPQLEVPDGFRPDRRLSPEAELFMVTIYPGTALYSTFGHTAIRVRDRREDIDLLFNYGQSSVPFDASFVPNFVTGELPFILGVSSTPRSYRFYRQVEDRSIYEQRLLLSAGEKEELYRFLAYNALPQNRVYIYDFFFDNCTTRVRDLFSLLFGPALGYALHPQEKSFREEIAPYLAHTPWVTLGINLVFGMPADTVPQPPQRLFLPFQLRDAVASAEVDRGGGTAPLEQDAEFIYRQERADPEPPPAGPAALLWAAAAAALILTLSPLRFSRGARIFDAVLFALVGAAGIAMVLLWAFSGYHMTTGNFNVLWAWPTHLAFAFAGFSSLRSRGWLRGYFIAAAGAAAGLIVLSPLIPQVFPPGGFALMSAVVFRAAARGALPLIEDYRWLLPKRLFGGLCR